MHLIWYNLSICFIIKIYTNKSRLSIPKRHNLFHVFASHEVRHLVLPWLLRSSFSLPIVCCLQVNFLLPKTIIHSKEYSFHFSCLLWILFKTDYYACILLVMVGFQIKLWRKDSFYSLLFQWRYDFIHFVGHFRFQYSLSFSTAYVVLSATSDCFVLFF